MVKNCDLGLENAALGLRPRAVFSRPPSQFFTIRTSQPANNIYIHELFTLGKVGTECRSSIGRKLAEKDAEFLFLVHKLFPRARLIANS